MQQFFQDSHKALLKSSDDKTCQFINEVVTPLATVDASYPEAFLQYWLNGDNPDFLNELNQRKDNNAGKMMGFPGKVGYYDIDDEDYCYDEDSDIEVAITGISARHQLYFLLFDIFTDEQIMRFGELLVAITQKKNIDELYPDTPVWFHCVVCDSHFTVFNYVDGWFKPRADWSCEKLLNVLQTANVEDAERKLIGFFLGRKSLVPEYFNDLLEVPHFRDFLKLHQDIVVTIMNTLSVDEQAYFLEVNVRSESLAMSFTDTLVMLAISGNKGIRQTARNLLIKKYADKPSEKVQSLLHGYLDNGSATQRRHCLALLENNDENRALLVEKLASEKTKTVRTAIEETLSNWKKSDSVSELYTPPTFVDAPSQQLPESCVEAINEAFRNANADNEDFQKANKKGTDPSFGERTLAQLNSDELKPLSKTQLFILSQKKVLKVLHDCPEFSLKHAVLMSYLKKEVNWNILEKSLTDDMKAQVELRQIMKILTSIDKKVSRREIADEYLHGEMNPLFLTAEQLVPFFWEYSELLSESLGIIEPQGNRWWHYEPEAAFAVLDYFPAIPANYVDTLMEMALTKKTWKKQAQAVLAKVPDIHRQLFDKLNHKRAETRQTVAAWLADIGQTDHTTDIVNALNEQLKKEKDNAVTSVIVDALETLGEDISAYLSEASLLAEAEKGLKSKIPEHFAWFDLTRLPAMQWQNGNTVNPTIIQWWVVMANKQNNPEPQRVFLRYLNLLDENSQQTLGKYLFHAFVNEDTRTMSLAEATEIAKEEAPSDLARYQRWYQSDPDGWCAKYKDITLEHVEQEIIKKHMSELLGSAIKSKGILTLANKASGGEIVKTLQDFMKKHRQRLAQIKALISAFRGTSDPMMIQCLLTIARKSRAQTVSELAYDIVTDIADQNGWTADELADRTIPTAGLDDDGILRLDYGEREIKAMLNDKNVFVIENDKGNIVKSLPQARQNEDKAVVKEARSQFSNSKKELKQVLEQQTTRLYENMCRARLWSSDDWQTYLFEHPIMKRLITRLVWLAGDEKGNVEAFRPCEDGSLLNLDDDEITLQTSQRVQIAHRVLLNEDDSQAWLAHFKDYEVTPLFSQLEHTCPDIDAETKSLNHYVGYVTDTFTLRSLMGKQDYQRGGVYDGGGFSEYQKNHDSLGITTFINFSGSIVPEDERPAVLHDMVFYENRDALLLSNVPKILLAESFAEYTAIAKGTSGFDENWEKIDPWA